MKKVCTVLLFPVFFAMVFSCTDDLPIIAGDRGTWIAFTTTIDTNIDAVPDGSPQILLKGGRVDEEFFGKVYVLSTLDELEKWQEELKEEYREVSPLDEYFPDTPDFFEKHNLVVVFEVHGWPTAENECIEIHDNKYCLVIDYRYFIHDDIFLVPPAPGCIFYILQIPKDNL